MQTVLCLGNPGERYACTRHNAGFLVADRLVERYGGGWAHGPQCLLARFAPTNDRPGFEIVKPLTWMNNSGDALLAFGGGYAPGSLLVVADEVNLPLGRIRLRAEGSAGGHNGLASVEQTLGRRDYHRLRVGVGAGAPVEGAALIDFVLGEFAESERELLKTAVELAVQAVSCWLVEGIGAAQSRFNGLATGVLRKAGGPQTADVPQTAGVPEESPGERAGQAGN